MTTIAMKNGTIACDKQGTNYGRPSTAGYKAIRDGDTVYLITGTLYKGLKFVDWLCNDGDGKPPKFKGTYVYEFDLITGNLLCYEGQSYPIPILESIWSDGSGGDVALGAMAHGATAPEAVKIAMKYDVFTGKGVQSWTCQRELNKQKKTGIKPVL